MEVKEFLKYLNKLPKESWYRSKDPVDRGFYTNIGKNTIELRWDYIYINRKILSTRIVPLRKIKKIYSKVLKLFQKRIK